MLEILRRLGLHMGTAGAGLMEQMIRKQITAKDLTYKQVKDVLYAWDARHIVPIHLQEEMKKNGDIVKPSITEEEVLNNTYSQEEYDRNYVEMIEKYLNTIM